MADLNHKASCLPCIHDEKGRGSDMRQSDFATEGILTTTFLMIYHKNKSRNEATHSIETFRLETKHITHHDAKYPTAEYRLSTIS